MAIILGPNGGGPASTVHEITGDTRQQMALREDEAAFTRERKHACSMCHKRFDRPSTLKKVMMIH
ncbi:hypothetical protein MPER_02446 [Moniliophthora perniciosa FA553]|nr:hypothetical protein MPER_02446 [Moniliophthora perniciosa FA553]